MSIEHPVKPECEPVEFITLTFRQPRTEVGRLAHMRNTRVDSLEPQQDEPAQGAGDQQSRSQQNDEENGVEKTHGPARLLMHIARNAEFNERKRPSVNAWQNDPDHPGFVIFADREMIVGVLPRKHRRRIHLAERRCTTKSQVFTSNRRSSRHRFRIDQGYMNKTAAGRAGGITAQNLVERHHRHGVAQRHQSRLPAEVTPRGLLRHGRQRDHPRRINVAHRLAILRQTIAQGQTPVGPEQQHRVHLKIAQNRRTEIRITVLLKRGLHIPVRVVPDGIIVGAALLGRNLLPEDLADPFDTVVLRLLLDESETLPDQSAYPKTQCKHQRHQYRSGEQPGLVTQG